MHAYLFLELGVCGFSKDVKASRSQRKSTARKHPHLTTLSLFKEWAGGQLISNTRRCLSFTKKERSFSLPPLSLLLCSGRNKQVVEQNTNTTKDVQAETQRDCSNVTHKLHAPRCLRARRIPKPRRLRARRSHVNSFSL